MFGISHPKPGQKIKLFKHKFAASGRAPSGCHPIIGILKGTNADSIIMGRTLREPRQGRKTWIMTFDLEEIPGIESDSFSLSIHQLDKDGQLHQLADPVENIKFKMLLGADDESAIVVTLATPDPNTSHCRYSFMSYGLLSGTDTRLDKAELVVENTMSTPLTESFKDSDNEGFWVVTFDELPDSSTTMYKLTVFGNSTSANVPGLKFLGSECT